MSAQQGGHPIFVSLIIGPLGEHSHECTPSDAHRWRAKLDGVDVSDDCVEADDVKGYVMLIAKDADGRPMFGPGQQRNPTYKRVFGRVELKAPTGEKAVTG